MARLPDVVKVTSLRPLSHLDRLGLGGLGRRRYGRAWCQSSFAPSERLPADISDSSPQVDDRRAALS